MNKKVKEPFIVMRSINFILGVIILVLMLLVLLKIGPEAIFEMLIFTLAAVETFIGAIINLSENKRVRGTVYAVICSVFLIMALILAVRYFVFV